MERTFRLILVIWWVSLIAGVLLNFSLESTLPLELRAYLDRIYAAELTLDEAVVSTAGLIVFAIVIASSIGLYRLKRRYARIFLAGNAIAVFLSVFSGPYVMDAYSSVLFDLESVSAGAIIAMSYTTGVLQQPDLESADDVPS